MRARSLAIVLAASCLLAALPAEASVEQYLGRTLVDVQVEIAGRQLTEASILSLIETRVGEPLAMTKVRATIDHLVGLGRFADVRLYASGSETGVVLRWLLVPIKRIGATSLTGRVALADKDVLAELRDRLGVAPIADRVPEAVTVLQSFYAERGYLAATITPRLVDSSEPDRADLVIAIDAGERTVIGELTIHGTPINAPNGLPSELGLTAGRPYDGPAITVRIAAYEEELRGLGYYGARVRESHTFSADGRTAAMTLEVEPGPRVRLVFEGDPLPSGERQTLVPIRQERSVDFDLLEDASRNIEASLRRQGYRAAQAPYARDVTSGELVLTFTVARGPLHRVGEVDVAGMSGLERSELQPLLQLKTGEPFVDARVGAVASAIAELYRVRGYSLATVTPAIQVLPPDTRATPAFRPVDVRFDIVEGPQTVIASVDLGGAGAFDESQLRGMLGLAAGKPYYRPQLSVDRDAIEHAYRSNGYQSVSVAPQVFFDADGREARVTWAIREGAQIQVDHVLIAGNDKTNADLIRNEITLKPGGPMSDDALIESQRRLAVLGLFRRVRISQVPREGSTLRDVLIEVEEADSTTVSYGGGVEVSRIYKDDENGTPSERLYVAPRAFFDITRRNFWGKNRSVTLFGRVSLKQREPAADNPDPTDTGGYGLNDYRAFFSFREPRVFGTKGDGQTLAFVEQGIRTSFNFNRKGVSADYARRISASVTITGRYTFDYTQLFDEQIQPKDQLLIDRLFPQVKLSKFFAAVLRDSRDDVLDPQKGAVVGVDASVAAPKLGSEVGFVKSFTQAFIYRRVPGRKLVVAAGARLGVAVGYGVNVVTPSGTSVSTDVRDLPASERFFAGGDTTVRGFSLDQLGTDETLDPQGFPQGGNALAVFNLETRAPYWKNVQFVWFADSGNVFKYAGDIRLSELRVTSGVGFRYRSPIGPLRVDWGWKVSTRLLLEGGRERSNVVHISLGQAF